NGSSDRLRIIGIGNETAVVPTNDPCHVGCFGSNSQHGAAGCEDPIQFARDHYTLEAAADSDDMEVTRRHYVGHFSCGPEGEKTHPGVSTGQMTQAAFGGAAAHEDHSNGPAVEEICGLQKRIPRAIESQISSVEHDKAKAGSDFLHHRMVAGRLDIGNGCAVAHHGDSGG